MGKHRWAFVAMLVAVFALVGSACGGGGSDGASGGGDGSGSKVDSADCGLDALEQADAPVKIDFWYQQVAQAGSIVRDLVTEFEASHPEVKVKLVQFPTYPDLYQKYRAGLGTSNLPDLAQMEETTVQSLVDSQSTVPVQACVDADHYDLSDYLPRAISYYTTQNVLRSMPWNISNPVLYYNKTAFRAAGLDPEKPPTTLAEVRDISQKLVDSGAVKHGMSLRAQHYLNEFWFAKGGQEYVNNGNGRTARATKAQLDSSFGRELWTWWDDMVDSGLAINTGAEEGNIDHLLALANGQAAMTIEASSGLGPVTAVLKSGQYKGVEVGVAALPGLEPGGGVPVGDGSLWLPKASSPEKRAAAWELIKFLNEPENQAKLHVAAGYVPTRMSAIEDPAVKALWAQDPNFRVSYDQLTTGPNDAATSGSVIGDYQGVRDAVTDGLVSMFQKGTSPADALAHAQAAADKAIADYNERVAG